RATLAEEGQSPDLLADFRAGLQDLCRALGDRAAAVDQASAQGLYHHGHPGEIPDNIHGARGPWETYSTPGRDVNLRRQLRDLKQLVASAPGRLRVGLRESWQQAESSPRCRISYRG